MRVSDAIRMADDVSPNAFDEATKVAWLNEAEGLVQTDVMLVAIEDVISYTWDADPLAELLAKPPHDKLYWVYVAAMIDFANGEYNRYQNKMQMFNAHFGEYMRWFAERYRPADGEDVQGWPGYYISAYGIAVKHGFAGTEEDWLLTLRGERGPQGETGATGATGPRGEKGEQGVSGVYVGSGDMPAGYNVQIDPNGSAYSEPLTELEALRTKRLLMVISERINTYDDLFGGDDRTASKMWELYPTFEELRKKSYTAKEKDFKFQYGNKLYKTKKANHTFTVQNQPSVGTASLYAEIYRSPVLLELQKMPDGYKQDGNITTAEWGEPVVTNVVDGFGTVEYWFRHDGTNLYVALRADATADAFKNGYTWWSNMYFNGDGFDGHGTEYREAYWYAKGGTAIDVSGGTASCKQNGGTITVEVTLPLSSFAVTDSAYDIRFQHQWIADSTNVPGAVYEYPTDAFYFSVTGDEVE